jgi:hypothetical protein
MVLAQMCATIAERRGVLARTGTFVKLAIGALLFMALTVSGCGSVARSGGTGGAGGGEVGKGGSTGATGGTTGATGGTTGSDAGAGGMSAGGGGASGSACVIGTSHIGGCTLQ